MWFTTQEMKQGKKTKNQNSSNNNILKQLTLFFQGPILCLYKMFVSERAWPLPKLPSEVLSVCTWMWVAMVKV